MVIPDTRQSLIARIQDASDQQAWQEFTELYAPIIYRFAQRGGLQDADALDIIQDVFRAIADSLERWRENPDRSSFRNWLFGVTRNKMLQFWSQQKRQIQGAGDTRVKQLLDQQPADEQADSLIWQREFDRHVLQLAAMQIKADFSETTWQAFWQTAVEGKSGKDVAASLGISVGNIYVYKGRVMLRLKQRVTELTKEV